MTCVSVCESEREGTGEGEGNICFVFRGALISEVCLFVHICNLRAISRLLALCLLDSYR